MTLLFTLYLCLLGPAHAWGRVADSRIHPRILQLAASVAWTTCTGLALAAAERFSLFNLLAVNALTTVAGFVTVRRSRPDEAQRHDPRVWPGMLLATAAFVAYAPPMETHLAGSDSTTYVASGIHLAESGHLWVHDDLSEALPLPALRLGLFAAAAGGNPLSPPFGRIPGGLILQNWDHDVAWPSFFPAPMVWAAIASSILGPRFAGMYAPLFAALALLMIWPLARRRMGLPVSVLAVVLVAANAANVWIARFPMSESLAFFFVWSALVAIDTWEAHGKRFDAVFAGLMFGAAAVTRIDFAVLIIAAWTLHTALAARRPTPLVFALALGAMLVPAIGELTILQGAETVPVRMAFMGGLMRMSAAPKLTLAALAAIAAVVAVGAAVLPRSRFRRILAAVFFAAASAAYFFSGTPMEAGRSVSWLHACLGWPALALAVAGTWCLLAASRGDATGRFLVLFVWTTVLIVGYNPHSVPVLPLGWRRFAPVIVPGLLVLAAAAIEWAWRRSRVVAVCAGVVVLVGVVGPSHLLWSRDLYRGTFTQLESLADWLPPEGTLLVDSSLNATLPGIPLWLIHHRDVLPVDTSTTVGCSNLSMSAYALEQAGHGPLLLLAQSGARCERIADIGVRRLGEFPLELALPQQRGDQRPARVDEFRRTLTLDELLTNRSRSSRIAP